MYLFSIQLKTVLIIQKDNPENLGFWPIHFPAENAEVERVWSSVKNIINDRSTSMSRQCLESRLFVKNSKGQSE